jgi:hypothetical protein
MKSLFAFVYYVLLQDTHPSRHSLLCIRVPLGNCAKFLLLIRSRATAQRGDRNLLLMPPAARRNFDKMSSVELLLHLHHHHQPVRITMASIIQRAIITSASISPSPSSSISDSDSISSNDESEVKQTKQMKDWRPKSTFWQKKFRDMTWAERYDEAGTASFFFSLYLPALEL